MVERLVLVRQHRQRGVVAHRADRLFTIRGHRRHDELDVFLRVAEGLLAVEQRHAGALGLLPVGLDLIELDADALHPLGIGPA